MSATSFRFYFLSLTILFIVACSAELQPQSSHDDMVRILKKIRRENTISSNMYAPNARLRQLDSVLNRPNRSAEASRYDQSAKAGVLLELGKEREAIFILEGLLREGLSYYPLDVRKDLALAYLRLGERSNCITGHAAESCILPVRGMGVHQDPDGSMKAIRLYETLLGENPGDLESRWLLNLAYMTIGGYPDRVPAKFVLPGMAGDITPGVKPFTDIAGDLKLDVRNMSGGSITDDFNNDGYLDIVTCGWGTSEKMHYFVSTGNGSFRDATPRSGLKNIPGGLNIMQADYNNDGYADILVLRGAWKREFGKEPNSLLRNNGDDTFTDVTTRSGLLSFHPTQTATWNDFNNDGWLDLFIGNESVTGAFDGSDSIATGTPHPCELYINNQDGTFYEIAAKAQCDVVSYVKGVTSGDYNHDGWKDLYLSTMDGHNKLLKNKGVVDGEISFEDVTHEAGLDYEKGSTFPTWFWDYDNDGWLDIFVCDYTWSRSLAYYAAAEKLGMAAGSPDKMLLYRNNRNGTFTNVARQAGLTTNAFAMGSNFGDIDNDGYLDMYLGTGNPKYQSVIPNKMFRNDAGKTFTDVTTSARVGHLQKGHGVSFADMDNDGDQDIYIDMGGASPGDAYPNSFFLNPGQNTNRWIGLILEGTRSNRGAIGTSLKLTFRDNGKTRTVFRDVNSGGSFGSSPLRREIGIGRAEQIDELEIRWHGSGQHQVFRDVKPNQFIKITEGDDAVTPIHLKVIQWTLPDQLCYPAP